MKVINRIVEGWGPIIRSLNWDGDVLVDCVEGYAYKMDGTITGKH